MQGVEAIQARAKAFTEENQELLDDPETSSDVLGRMIVQGSAIAVTWNEEVIQPAADRFVQACNDYTEALEDKTLSPKELQKRVKVYRSYEADHERVVAGFGDFEAFMDEVRAKYHAKLDEEKLVMLEEIRASEEFLENAPEAPKEERPVSRSYKPSLWRRFFG